MKMTFKRIITLSLAMLICALSLCSCSSLPSELSGEKMKQPDTFMTQNPSDAKAKELIKKVTDRSDDIFDEWYVGYCEEDKTVYLLTYSSLMKNPPSVLDYSSVKPQIKDAGEELYSELGFGDYHCGIILVNGSKYSSSLEILLIVKDGEIVADNTDW